MWSWQKAHNRMLVWANTLSFPTLTVNLFTPGDGLAPMTADNCPTLQQNMAAGGVHEELTENIAYGTAPAPWTTTDTPDTHVESTMTENIAYGLGELLTAPTIKTSKSPKECVKATMTENVAYGAFQITSATVLPSDRQMQTAMTENIAYGAIPQTFPKSDPTKAVNIRHNYEEVY